MMKDLCAFSENHQCIKWEDYEITCQELKEADELCYQNWIEIQRLRDYIDKLKEILEEHSIDYPEL